MSEIYLSRDACVTRHTMDSIFVDSTTHHSSLLQHCCTVIPVPYSSREPWRSFFRTTIISINIITMSNSNPVSVTNPYARKPSTAATAQHSRPTTTTTTGAATRHAPFVAAAAVPGGGATSFSQAFESIEETAHYQGQIQRPHHGNNNNNTNTTTAATLAADAQARAQQRTFDLLPPNSSNNAHYQQNVDATSHADMSDRDQHVLLQPHVLYVSTKQRGNAILNFVRNVPWAYSTMVPDFIMNTTRCALFLSLKYHSLYPNYIHRRTAELKTDFTLRILLVLVDVQDNANVLLLLNKFAVTANLTLLLAWSEEEAARYLETFKAFDGKDAALIQKKEQTNFVDQVADFLGTCKGVNKTDSAQLLQQFSNVRSLMEADMDELGLVTGMGEVKVRRLHEAFHKPFSKKAAAAKRQKLLLLDERAAAEEPEDDSESETELMFDKEEEAGQDTGKDGGADATTA